MPSSSRRISFRMNKSPKATDVLLCSLPNTVGCRKSPTVSSNGRNACVGTATISPDAELGRARRAMAASNADARSRLPGLADAQPRDDNARLIDRRGLSRSECDRHQVPLRLAVAVGYPHYKQVACGFLAGKGDRRVEIDRLYGAMPDEEPLLRTHVIRQHPRQLGESAAV